MTLSRPWAARALLALSGLAGGVGGLLDLVGANSPVRAGLVVFFFAVAPTIAIAGLLGRFDPFARILLAFVANIAVVALVAVALLSLGIWSPGAGFVVVAVITGACLTVRHPRWYRDAMDRVFAARDRSVSETDQSASPQPVGSELSGPGVPAEALVESAGSGPAELQGNGAVLLEHLAEFQNALGSELADLIRVSERLRASDDDARRHVGQALFERAREMAAAAETEAAQRLAAAREELEGHSPKDEDSS